MTIHVKTEAGNVSWELPPHLSETLSTGTREAEVLNLQGLMAMFVELCAGNLCFVSAPEYGVLSETVRTHLVSAYERSKRIRNGDKPKSARPSVDD